MTNKKDDHVIKLIAENYKKLERSIVEQLTFNSQHQVTIGGFREEIWKSLFKQIIPKKFSIERSVFIIDSTGGVSKEVDLAIFDEQYTPYIFNYGQIKYIPIEAVAVAVQCKSTTVDAHIIDDWHDSITKLTTSLKSVTRMHSYIAGDGYENEMKYEQKQILDIKNTTQTATRPVTFLCHLDKKFTGKSPAAQKFDFVLFPEDNGQLKIHTPSDRTLGEWVELLNHANDEKYRSSQFNKKEPVPMNASSQDEQSAEKKDSYREVELNQYKIKNEHEPKEEIALLTLIFQLNQLLMLINNPLLFPHLSYVEMFKKFAFQKPD